MTTVLLIVNIGVFLLFYFLKIKKEAMTWYVLMWYSLSMIGFLLFSIGAKMIEMDSKVAVSISLLIAILNSTACFKKDKYWHYMFISSTLLCGMILIMMKFF